MGKCMLSTLLSLWMEKSGGLLLSCISCRSWGWDGASPLQGLASMELVRIAVCRSEG